MTFVEALRFVGVNLRFLFFPPQAEPSPSPETREPAMKITDDHWLEGAIRKPISGGSPMNTRRFLVIHFTDGATAESSISWWKNPAAKGASAHIVIDRDGTIYQCRPFNRTAGHAGTSAWKDPNTGRRFTSLNLCSIGIELSNAGKDEPGPDGWDWACKQPWFKTIRARHKNGGPTTEWELYPDAQLTACRLVSEALVKRYHLDDVVGHDDIAPDRKIDPGPAFPMGELRMACGFPPDLPKLT